MVSETTVYTAYIVFSSSKNIALSCDLALSFIVDRKPNVCNDNLSRVKTSPCERCLFLLQKGQDILVDKISHESIINIV